MRTVNLESVSKYESNAATRETTDREEKEKARESQRNIGPGRIKMYAREDHKGSNEYGIVCSMKHSRGQRSRERQRRYRYG